MLATLAASAILPLYGLLAFVVPSGHLPSGRWGQVARVALVAAVIIEGILVIAPTTLLVLPSHPDGTQVRISASARTGVAGLGLVTCARLPSRSCSSSW